MSQITWTIKGKLKVRSQFKEITAAFGDINGDVPLEGVRVKVSAMETKLDPTGFDEWGEDVTSADGSFQITKTKDHSQRYFRVEAKFEEDNILKIYPEDPGLLDGLFKDSQGTLALEAALGAVSTVPFNVDWINVWQDEEKKGPGVVDLRDITFAAIAGEGADGMNHRRHADLWFLARKAMSHLDSLGTGLGFPEKRPIAIKYPHSSPFLADKDERSYADPFNFTVFLRKTSLANDFEIETVMHELMHLRNYEHSTGEDGLALQLLLHGTTHDGRLAETWTGFHEAAAEVWKTELYRQLFGQGATIYGGMDAERRPFTRPWLKTQGIRTLDDVEHFEYGWISTFNLLLCRRVDELDINGSGPFAHEKTGPVGPTIAKKTVEFSFADLLTAFDPLPNHPDQIELSEMTISKFFRRLAEVNPAFDSDMQSSYRKILDPQETGQPSDLLPTQVLVKPLTAGPRLTL